MRRAIYPGSFDPITNGHLDVLKRALDVFDEVIVLVADNPNKKYFFSATKRLEMVKEACKGLKGVKVDLTSGLTVDYAKAKKTLTFVRGLRNATDYEYETKLLNEYRKSEPDVNMVFFMATADKCVISSSKVNELYSSKKDISKYVPKSVIEMYKKR